MSDLNEKSFIENYKILQCSVDELKNQEEADLDKIIPIIDEGLNAYKNCKSRIDKVKEMLNEKFNDLDS